MTVKQIIAGLFICLSAFGTRAQSVLGSETDPSGLFGLPAWHGNVVDARRAMMDDPRFFEQGDMSGAVYAFGSGSSGLIVNLNFGRVSSLSWLHLPGKHTVYEDLTPYGLSLEKGVQAHIDQIEKTEHWGKPQITQARTSVSVSYLWNDDRHMRMDLNYALPEERLATITISYNGNSRGLQSLWDMQSMGFSESVYALFCGSESNYGPIFYRHGHNKQTSADQDSIPFLTRDFSWLKFENNRRLTAGLLESTGLSTAAIGDSLTAILPPAYIVQLPDTDCEREWCVRISARAETAVPADKSDYPLILLMENTSGKLKLVFELPTEP